MTPPRSTYVAMNRGPSVFPLFAAVAFAIIVLGLRYGSVQPAPAITRPYHPATVAQLASGTFPYTHAQITGRVIYTRLEEDGDLHIRLVDTSASAIPDTIVGECLPALMCRRPATGSVVTIRGITRRDPEHRWWEVHPIEWESP